MRGRAVAPVGTLADRDDESSRGSGSGDQQSAGEIRCGDRGAKPDAGASAEVFRSAAWGCGGGGSGGPRSAQRRNVIRPLAGSGAAFGDSGGERGGAGADGGASAQGSEIDEGH